MRQEGEEDEVAKKSLKVCKYLKYFQFDEVLHCTFLPGTPAAPMREISTLQMVGRSPSSGPLTMGLR